APSSPRWKDGVTISPRIFELSKLYLSTLESADSQKSDL
ncbi:hypothetical protein LINPERHAP2_LOCUS11694, partial [Linum perenne]